MIRENFRPTNAREISFASFATNPPSFTKNPKLNKVQKLGLAYEKRVQEYVKEICGKDSACLFNPWIMYGLFGEGTSVFFCQPDCLILNRDERKITIIEIKYSHTGDSWKQLRQLYEPVVRNLYLGEYGIALLEICKWYDPHTKFPESFYYCEDILKAETNKLGVHIYKPRGKAIK